MVVLNWIELNHLETNGCTRDGDNGSKQLSALVTDEYFWSKWGVIRWIIDKKKVSQMRSLWLKSIKTKRNE